MTLALVLALLLLTASCAPLTGSCSVGEPDDSGVYTGPRPRLVKAVEQGDAIVCRARVPF